MSQRQVREIALPSGSCKRTHTKNCRETSVSSGDALDRGVCACKNLHDHDRNRLVHHTRLEFHMFVKFTIV